MCPKCTGYLNVGDKVIFTIKRKGWKGGVLMLSPTLGDYSYTHHPSFTVDEGEHFEFHCPICNFDLSVEGVDTFAKVILHEDGKEDQFVIFSKIKGEKCTYKVSEKQIIASYGEQAARHYDLLNMSFIK
jgi:hypothetical protein